MEYCEYHKEELIRIARTDDDGTDHTTNIGEWDQEFIAVDQEMVFEIILAANYLNIKPLLCVHFRPMPRPSHNSRPNLNLSSNVGCKTVANMMRDKNPEEIRKLFNIVNDYTPEEEVCVLYPESQCLSLTCPCLRRKSRTRMSGLRVSSLFSLEQCYGILSGLSTDH